MLQAISWAVSNSIISTIVLVAFCKEKQISLEEIRISKRKPVPSVLLTHTAPYNRPCHNFEGVFQPSNFRSHAFGIDKTTGPHSLAIEFHLFLLAGLTRRYANISRVSRNKNPVFSVPFCTYVLENSTIFISVLWLLKLYTYRSYNFNNVKKESHVLKREAVSLFHHGCTVSNCPIEKTNQKGGTHWFATHGRYT